MGFAPFRPFRQLLVATSVLIAGLSATAEADEKVTRALNQMMPQVSAENKAWTGLFDAYLDLTPCPREIGPDFDQIDVWPGMDDWGAIEDWASSNESLGAALKEASGKTIIGLPYGMDEVDARYQDAGLYAHVNIEDGGEVEIDFLTRAFRNIPGVELADVSSLNLLQLAPGGHVGRFVIWTEGAFAALDGLYGSHTTPSSAKTSGGTPYRLPQLQMTNADLSRLINSDEVQTKINAPKAGQAPKVLKVRPQAPPQ